MCNDKANDWWRDTGPENPVTDPTHECASCGDTGSCAYCRGGSTREPGFECVACNCTHRCPDCEHVGSDAP